MATMMTPLDPEYRNGAYCPAEPYLWPVRWCGATVVELMRHDKPHEAFSWAFSGDSERATLYRALRAYGAMQSVYEASLMAAGWGQAYTHDDTGEEGTACVYRGGDVVTECGGVFHAGGKIQVLGFYSTRRGWVVWSELGLVPVNVRDTTAYKGLHVYRPPAPWGA